MKFTNSFIEAVDTVCKYCVFKELSCELCPVRVTAERIDETAEEPLKHYEVVIHYEGAVQYGIDAENEDDAREQAERLMMNEDPSVILESIDWEVCDSWKAPNEE